MTDEQLIFALHLGLCVLLFGMGVPLWREKVRPNHWYGFRTPATIRDERLWYPVNRVTGRWMMATAVISAPVVVWTFLAGLPVGKAALTNLAAIVIGIVGMLVHGFTLLDRLKRDLHPQNTLWFALWVVTAISWPSAVLMPEPIEPYAFCVAGMFLCAAMVSTFLNRLRT